MDRKEDGEKVGLFSINKNVSGDNQGHDWLSFDKLKSPLVISRGRPQWGIGCAGPVQGSMSSSRNISNLARLRGSVNGLSGLHLSGIFVSFVTIGLAYP